MCETHWTSALRKLGRSDWVPSSDLGLGSGVAEWSGPPALGFGVAAVARAGQVERVRETHTALTDLDGVRDARRSYSCPCAAGAGVAEGP